MAKTTLRPLSIVLCAIFLFSAHVFAVSAVLGVDIGTEYIKAALVKPGIPLEIVLTKDSRRKEISAVAFKPPQNEPKAGSFPERAYGSDAIALAPRFPGNVYPNLKAVLGLPADSAEAKEYATRHPDLQLETDKLRGTVAFQSKGAFIPDEGTWLVEELLAMELQSIRSNAEALAGPDSKVRSVVITVPPFYTAEEKRAIELAADLAGLRVLSLISDGLAVGLQYATRSLFPNINAGGKPEHHMVFDMGAGSTKATVMRFQSRTVKDIGKYNKTVQEVQVLGSGWDRTLGGDGLNSLIVDDMVEQFVSSSGAKKLSVASESVKAHGRAVAKLSKEAERLRHVLSANTNAQASFEGLYEDVDFKYKISRADFEALSTGHASRVAKVIQAALDMAGLRVENLNTVILHGGATRTPFVQKELETILGGADRIRNNVNSDEAAVFGAGFKAAELSPSFRVKEIRTSEAAFYPAGMKWTSSAGKPQNQRLWTATSSLGAAPKEVTFSNQEDFAVTFYQQVPASGIDGSSVDRETMIFSTTNLTATVAELTNKYSCESSGIQFKVSLRLSSEDGEVDVIKATVECEAEEPEKEGFVDGVKNLFGFGKKEQQPLKGEEEPSNSTESAEQVSASTESETTSATVDSSSEIKATPSSDMASASESANDSGATSNTKQLVVIPVDYTVQKSGVPQLPAADLLELKDRLKAFEASDRSRRQREEALNQLEGYTYKVRDLLDNEAFVTASTAKERADLQKKNSEASDWLYGDGTEATREDLKSRLKELQDIVVPIQTRIEEESERPKLIEDLRTSLNQTREFLDNIKKQIAEVEAWSASHTASSSTASEGSSPASSESTPTDDASTDTSASASTDQPTVTPAPSLNDFAGLEDDDTATKSVTKKRPKRMQDVLEDRGPVPPLYKLEDLQETEDLYESTLAWLDEKEAKQDKLGPTDDPAIRVKDLKERREKLNKVGVDLAMKGVKNFESKSKKSSSTKSTKTKKSKSTSTKSKKQPAATIDLGPDGEMWSEEDIEEMLKRFDAIDKEKNQQEGEAARPAGGEPTAPAAETHSSDTPGSTEQSKERKHEEL